MSKPSSREPTPNRRALILLRHSLAALNTAQPFGYSDHEWRTSYSLALAIELYFKHYGIDPYGAEATKLLEADLDITA